MDMLSSIVTNGVQAAFGPIGALYALTAIGLNVHFGYTGLLNFGQVGFMLVGAYGLAVSVAIFQLPFLVGILVAIAVSVVLALLLGAPTLRLRADYLAITTIAAAEILRFVARSRPATDLTAGVFGIPSQFSDGRGFSDAFYRWSPLSARADYGIGPFTWSGRELWVMIVVWGTVGLGLLLVWALMRSPWGRVIKSIREDEDAARSLGKNVFAYKMQALVLGGVFGGLGGVAFALNQASVTPDAFLPQLTFFTYTIVILGGAATIFGPVLGAVAFWFLVAGTDVILRQSDLFAGDAVGATRLALVGLGLMLLMVFRPQGVLGNKREMMLDA
jgi:branched-chain amino acid transport system permease protein